jgi:GTPase SAR1 family protein
MATSGSLELPSLQKLQSAEQLELFDVVDTLRARGLSEIVALPQLIVCGDQSSGKSSVLEAISGIPFPRQQSLCTRFATEVILRRAAKPEITVSILPGEDRTTVERDELLNFHHELKSKDDFKGLFEAATNAMGLSSGRKSFSNDVLRIEYCGPSQPQLTLVDLPGLIHSAIKQQTAQDVSLVHTLVAGYLINPRSILLAVVSAKNDSNNQVILNKARDVDPRGLRTLGIITKPDTLTRGSKDEREFIALANNETVVFSLGWHVVRNLDLEKEKDELETRDEKESLFFKESNFSSLPSHILGINFLRSRLSKVIFDQIRTELPRLVDDISSQISVAKAVQAKLGPGRAEPDEQKSFLTELSQTFQRICRDAVRGNCEDEFFLVDTDSERRLCANVMNKHFDFANDMRENGANWIIQDEGTCKN